MTLQLQDVLADNSQTSFSVVSIPTALSLAESKRLLIELAEQDVGVGMVAMNRVVDAKTSQQGSKALLATQQVALRTAWGWRPSRCAYMRFNSGASTRVAAEGFSD